jgi:hypothetical protein
MATAALHFKRQRRSFRGSNQSLNNGYNPFAQDQNQPDFPSKITAEGRNCQEFNQRKD